MQNLDVYLKEILYRFDRVVIPTLGEFISYYKPAYRDKAKHVFYPPSKHLSFSTNGRVFDDLLVSEIAKKTEESKTAVRDFVQKEVNNWKASLEENNRLELDKIGTLLLSKTGNITFQADQTENYLLDAFGLFPVYSPQIVVEEKTKVIEFGTYTEAEVVEEISLSSSTALRPVPRNSNGSALPVKWHSTFKKYKVSVAAAAGLLLVPTAYFFGNSELNSDSQLSLLNPFSLLSEATYQPRQVGENNEVAENTIANSKIIEENPHTETGTVVADLKASSIKPVAKIATIPEVKATTKENIYGDIDQSLKYHLINGCYKEEENAAKWVRNLRKKGHDAYILDKHKGLYRVSMGSYTSRKLAHTDYAQLKRDGVKSWILKK